MNRVREQGHAPRDRNDDDLDQRGRQQSDERPLERPQPASRGRDRRIDEPVGMTVPVATRGVCVRCVPVPVPGAVLMRVRVIGMLVAHVSP